jgi:hypothetical protein
MEFQSLRDQLETKISDPAPPGTMASPFHDPNTTGASLVEQMPPLLSIHEGNSLSMNVHSWYPFPANPWVPFDPNFVWPCLPAQFDTLLTWPTANNALSTYGTGFANYFQTPSSLTNLGHTGNQGPRVEDTFAAPLPVNYSTGHLPQVIVDKHASSQEQTAYEAQKTKMAE